MFAYPLMAQAVRDYLPVPSAKVGIERVFSGGRDVLASEEVDECGDHAMANAVE
jgi:hypothetical protein